MANRVVSVALKAEIGQYVSGMSKAAAATMRVGEAAKKTQVDSSKGFDLAGKGALIMGGAVVAGLGMAIKKSMDFEKSMSAVQAATQASGATLDQLRATAIKAGADTMYSATQAADAITEMGKAGVSAKDIMSGGLTGALNLAAAGQMNVADAAGVASTAMVQFRLTGAQIPHVADLLAAGAGKAMGSVDDLGQALNQAGLLASSTGISIEETTGTLAAFASAGLIGSDAGTSFKTMLQQLQAPSKQQADLMKQLGISAYDVNGNFVGLAGLAQQLRDKLGPLTQAERDHAIAQIFGTDAARAANVLYREGAKGIEDWTKKVNDAGYAQRQASQLTNNLSGDLERLGGSFDTFLISAGTGAQGPLRSLVQGLTGIVNVAGDLVGVMSSIPGPVWLVVGALTAAKLLGGPVAKLFQGVGFAVDVFAASARNAGGPVAAFKSTVGGIASSISPAQVAIAGITMLVPALIEGFHELNGTTAQTMTAQQGLVDALKATNGIIDDNARKAAQNALVQAGLVHTFSAAGVSAKDAIDGLLGNADAQDRVTASLQAYILANPGTVHSKAATAAMESRAAYLKLADSLGMSKEQAQFFADAATGATKATGAVGTAADATKAQIDAAAKAQEAWMKELQQVGSAFVDPLNTYKDLLSQKQQAEQASAQATADSTKSSKDSWKDYVKNVQVSLGELAGSLEKQITDQENWRTNLAIVAQRAGYDVAQALAAMGKDGVTLTAQMAHGTDAEVKRMGRDITRDAQLGGGDAAAALDTAMKVMALVGAKGSKATALSISKQLGIGVADVERIAAAYGAKLASGLNPVLTALGKTGIHISGGGATGGIFAAGGTQLKWSGGYTGDGGKYEPKGIVHGGEFVFTKEQTANAGVDSLYGLAAMLSGYSGGGFVSATSVPHPPSTAPYRMPISTAADASMAREFTDAVSWMKANSFTPVGVPGGVPTSVTGNAAIIQRIASGYGWGAGAEWAALYSLIMRESGFRNTAQNPTSTAYGIFQFLNSTWGAYGGTKTSDPAGQGILGLRYIQQRYGTPLGAMAHENQFGWYEKGTNFVPNDGLAYLHKGEAVVPAEINRRSREMSSAARSRGGSGVWAAPNVTVNARVFIGNREITDIARVEAESVMAGALDAHSDRGTYNP